MRLEHSIEESAAYLEEARALADGGDGALERLRSRLYPALRRDPGIGARVEGTSLRIVRC